MQCYYYPTIYLPARWERGMQRVLRQYAAGELRVKAPLNQTSTDLSYAHQHGLCCRCWLQSPEQTGKRGVVASWQLRAGIEWEGWNRHRVCDRCRLQVK
jgi:hypothetical protein